MVQAEAGPRRKAVLEEATIHEMMLTPLQRQRQGLGRVLVGAGKKTDHGNRSQAAGECAPGEGAPKKRRRQKAAAPVGGAAAAAGGGEGAPKKRRRQEAAAPVGAAAAAEGVRVSSRKRVPSARAKAAVADVNSFDDGSNGLASGSLELRDAPRGMGVASATLTWSNYRAAG
eukprot:g13437.t1